MYVCRNSITSSRRESLNCTEMIEFKPRTMWSLSNAFTSAFKELDPVPRFKATAKLAAFLAGVPDFGVALPAVQSALPS